MNMNAGIASGFANNSRSAVTSQPLAVRKPRARRQSTDRVVECPDGRRPVRVGAPQNGRPRRWSAGSPAHARHPAPRFSTGWWSLSSFLLSCPCCRAPPRAARRLRPGRHSCGRGVSFDGFLASFLAFTSHPFAIRSFVQAYARGQSLVANASAVRVVADTTLAAPDDECRGAGCNGIVNRHHNCECRSR